MYLYFLGLCLARDGSLVHLLWAFICFVSFLQRVSSAVAALFLFCGILRTWPKYMHLLFNRVELICPAITLSMNSSLVMLNVCASICSRNLLVYAQCCVHVSEQ